MTDYLIPETAPAAPPTPISRLGRGLLRVWRAAIADPVAAGRIRAAGWPYGLAAVVITGLVTFAAAVGLALFSVPLRRTGELVVPNSLESAVPASLVWILVLLLTVSLALLHTGAIHGPWWSLTLGLLMTLTQLGMWGAAIFAIGGGWWGVPVMIMTMVGMIIFSLVRKRRGFVWWEFPVVLGVTGAVVAAGLGSMAGRSRDFGFAYGPVFLDQFVQVLEYFVLPAALVAGAAVAEIAVGLTVAVTRQAQRLTRRHWPYVIIAVIAAVRCLQIGLQLAGLDPVDQGPLALIPALVLVTGFALVCWAMITVSHRAGARDPVTSELPEGLGRVGLPVAVALLSLQVPIVVLIFGLNIVGFVDPEHRLLHSAAFLPQVLIQQGLDGFRLLLGVVLMLLAVRLARRGRVEIALLLGCVAVMLVGLSLRLLTGYRWAFWLDPDSINLVATVAVLIMVLALMITRRLTPHRCLALAAVLVISALFSSRDFVSDPVGAVLGYSGVALVLFGVVWDFLTASSWANGDSRRFPRPTRVLFVLTYSLLTAVILAYAALVRRRTDYGDLDSFASLGDLVLGTALLAAAAGSLVAGLRQDRPVA